MYIISKSKMRGLFFRISVGVVQRLKFGLSLDKGHLYILASKQDALVICQGSRSLSCSIEVYTVG